MQVIKDTIDFCLTRPSVITLGKFDGVHRGHQALIKEVLAASRSSQNGDEPLSSVVFSICISPVTLLTRPERRELLAGWGIDTLIECPFIPAFITMEAEDFVREFLVGRLHAKAIIVGKDYRFGYGRRGNVEMLEKMGRELGFSVRAISMVKDGLEPISSSRIRSALAEGDMETVNCLLGYSFFINGSIIHGRRIGRTIGFPTTNLIPGMGKLLPPNGVYAVRSVIGDKAYYGITNLGTKPTVDGRFIGVETFLYNCSEDLYGEEQKVELLHFIRPERKFPSIEALKEQILTDREDGRLYFSGVGIEI